MATHNNVNWSEDMNWQRDVIPQFCRGGKWNGQCKGRQSTASQGCRFGVGAECARLVWADVEPVQINRAVFNGAFELVDAAIKLGRAKLYFHPRFAGNLQWQSPSVNGQLCFG